MNKIAKERNHICSSSQKIFAVIHEGNKSFQYHSYDNQFKETLIVESYQKCSLGRKILTIVKHVMKIVLQLKHL